MNDVLIIATGGTIDKTYAAGSGIRNMTLGISQIPHVLSQARSIERVIVQLMAKDSLDMTQKDREQIALFCAETPHQRIVVTHGSDTMHATAQTIESMVKDKVVVLTGSAQPWILKGSDADFNLGLAVGAASCANPGVYMAMNGQVRPHAGFRKNPETGIFEYIG